MVYKCICSDEIFDFYISLQTFVYVKEFPILIVQTFVYVKEIPLIHKETTNSPLSWLNFRASNYSCFPFQHFRASFWLTSYHSHMFIWHFTLANFRQAIRFMVFCIYNRSKIDERSTPIPETPQNVEKIGILRIWKLPTWFRGNCCKTISYHNREHQI